MSAAPPVPIYRSYWVVEGKFLAGEYPRDKDGSNRFHKLEALRAAGVSLFVDLTEESELLPYDAELKTAQHRRFPIRDVSVPRSTEHTSSILEA